MSQIPPSDHRGHPSGGSDESAALRPPPRRVVGPLSPSDERDHTLRSSDKPAGCARPIRPVGPLSLLLRFRPKPFVPYYVEDVLADLAECSSGAM